MYDISTTHPADVTDHRVCDPVDE